MDLKAPLSFNEQLEKLKAHGMIIKNDEEAIKYLKQINYYRFTGYALQFRKSPDKSEYEEGTTFEKVKHLYQLDINLRDTFRKYIELIEIYYRTQIAYGFSIIKCKNPPHDQHYDESNFCSKKYYNDIMSNFDKEKNYYKDSLIVKHHSEKYSGKMPLWVMVELMAFSNLSKLYSAMYYSEQNYIAAQLGTTTKKLKNHLHCMSVLRNKCAHAARMYNSHFNPPAMLKKSFLRKYPEVKPDTLFAYTITLIRLLPEGKDKTSLIENIIMVIDEYKDDIQLSLIGFPANYSEILNKREYI